MGRRGVRRGDEIRELGRGGGRKEGGSRKMRVANFENLIKK